MNMVWRVLLILLAVLWLWHRFAPVRWQIWHDAARRLAWMMSLVFGAAFLWRMWELFGH